MKQLLPSLILAAALLPACTDPTPEADLTFLILSEHNRLDPQRMAWVHDIRIADHLFEPLLRYDHENDTFTPAAAESFDVSDDYRTFTFRLRENARWSNGDPLTSDDFRYAWRRAMLPDTASDYASLMFRIEGARDFFDWRADQLENFDPAQTSAEDLWEQTRQRFDQHVGLETPDPRTLIVRTEQVTPYFLHLVSFVTFVPLHADSASHAQALDPASGWVDFDSAYWSDPERLISNGPYRLESRRPNQWLLMHANEHYWNRDAMGNDSVLQRIVSSESQAHRLYRRGEADYFPMLPSGRRTADLLDDDRNDVHVIERPGTYFYNFNSAPELTDGRANPLHDPRVRRALAMAIDRQAIVRSVTEMNEPVAETYIPPGVLPDYPSPMDHAQRYDPQRARELLSEAGYPEGEGLTGLTLLYNTEGEHGPIAEAISHMWRQKLGVRVRPEGVELATYNHRRENLDYTIARASWLGSYPEPTYWLDRMRSDDGNNHTGWANKQYDALLDAAAREENNQRRLEMLADAEAVLLDEQPMAFIFQYVSVSLYDPQRVRNLAPNPWGRPRLENVQITQ